MTEPTVLSLVRKLNAPQETRDTEPALKTLDEMREAVLNGQMSGFVAVSIAPDDETAFWVATTEPVSRLRALGAITALQLNFLELSDE